METVREIFIRAMATIIAFVVLYLIFEMLKKKSCGCGGAGAPSPKAEQPGAAGSEVMSQDEFQNLLSQIGF